MTALEHWTSSEEGSRAPTVLVIEDSDTQRAMLESRLAQLGFRVAAVPDGRDSVRLLSEARPDIVLLDVVMPDFDGWQTLELIRGMSSVPVIMLTAGPSDEERVRGLRTGADDYLCKPF